MTNTLSKQSNKMKALQRILETPELKKYYGHLAKKDWPANHFIWKWLSDSPTSVLQKVYGNFDESFLKQRSFRIAGHAMTATLLGIEVIEINSLPDPDNYCVGKVITRGKIDNIKWTNRCFYWNWALAVNLLAGSALQSKLTGKLEKGLIPEIFAAVQIAKYGHYDPQAQQQFFASCLFGVSQIINKPSIVKMVESIGLLLNRYGVVAPKEIEELIKGKILDSLNRPEIINIIRKAYEAMFDTQELLNALDIKNPNYLKIIEHANSNFAQELADLALKSKYFLDEEFAQHVTNPQYWRNEFTG